MASWWIREQARHPRTFRVGASHEVSGTLRRHHQHVEARFRGDLIEVDVEAVSEHQGVAIRQIGGDLGGVEVGHVLIGHQHHHDVRPAGDFRHGTHR